MHPLTELTVPDGTIALHWFEQSSFAFKDSQGTTILIDPYFPHERPAERFVHAEPPVDESTLSSAIMMRRLGPAISVPVVQSQ